MKPAPKFDVAMFLALCAVSLAFWLAAVSAVWIYVRWK